MIYTLYKNINQFMHTTECCSVMRKKKILPFVTVLMDVEDIILSEISQRKANAG